MELVWIGQRKIAGQASQSLVFGPGSTALLAGSPSEEHPRQYETEKTKLKKPADHSVVVPLADCLVHSRLASEKRGGWRALKGHA
jgi:hypothetical protein